MEINKKELTGYPSLDQPWLSLYNQIFDEKDVPHKSIYQLVLEANKYNMDKIALDMRTCRDDYKNGIKITYGEFFDKINANAKSSFAAGVKPNEIVPTILPNIPEARTLIYSNSVLGATAYPISPLLPVNQLDRIISENGIRTIFVLKEFYEKYANALQYASIENIVLLDGTESLPKEMRINNNGPYPRNSKIISWNEYQKAGEHIPNLTPYYEDDSKHVAVIVGTSGTTGISKGACLTDRNVNSASMSFKNGKIFEGSFVDALMPSIAYGISMMNLQTLSGTYVYLIPELLIANAPKALAQLKPDNFAGGPVHYITIKKSEEYRKGLLTNHNNYISGGASLPKDLEKTLNGEDKGRLENNEDNIFVRQGYGLTEYVAKGTYTKKGAYKFGSVGIPLPYDVVSIFKPGTDEELSYNQNGEICITGPSVMKGYLNNPDETNIIIKVHKDGKRWIHTQDIGYMDEDGCLFHVDRIKNIFMRTGFNVHPSKIADFINSIPCVKNSAVIGFEHPQEQCVPIAFIEFEPESLLSSTEKELLEEIKQQCFRNLEETSVPYDYIIVDTIPINLGGKIDKELIKNISEIDLNQNSQVLKRTLKFNK